MRNSPRLAPKVSDVFACRPTSHGDLGLFATHALPAGRRVLTFAGAFTALGGIEDFTHCLEIAPGLFLGPSGKPDDYVNHSCEPNCRVRMEGSAAVLCTLRPVARGEELTFDYSTMMVLDPTRFPCRCGSARCRGLILPFHRLPPAARIWHHRHASVPAWVSAYRNGTRPRRARP